MEIDDLENDDFFEVFEETLDEKDMSSDEEAFVKDFVEALES